MNGSKNVRYPSIRMEIINSLVQLSSISYQQSHWLGSEQPEARLDDVIHRLFDDTALVDDPSACLDEFLTNDTELNAVLCVVSALDSVLRKYGTALIDIEYTHKPEWAEVVSRAQDALNILNEP